MTSFEKEIQKRLKITIWGTVLTMVAVALAFTIRLSIGGYSLEVSIDHLFVMLGIFAGIVVAALIKITRFRNALKNKNKLEELYIKETDERNRIIILKTCRACITITLTFLGIGAIIASLFNEIVFFTLGIVLILILILYLTLRVYYTNR
ncbi:hypothetical protein NSA47_00600 [Irregularibacter muris]|uniref:DUF2178 domain-containing protein n=1 Tax=Irregularibacter muris TaxID=1796619 RepID=A0AAE3HDS1_9FIRM|nr:hypothetical protein [Irregularibacter muris]MCR1897489.1 hypothetical protein [Irregularibacter muris]